MNKSGPVAPPEDILTLTHGASVTSVAFSPDGRYVLTGSADNTAVIWDSVSGVRITTRKHGGSVHSVAFSPDGRLALTGSASNNTVLWKTRNAGTLETLALPEPVSSVAFSPDGRYLLTGSANSIAVIWSDWGSWLHTLEHGDAVQSVAFSPDSRSVLTGAADNTAVIWDAGTGNRRTTLKHEAPVQSVAFSPTGHSLVTGSADHTAVIWDASTGNPRTTLKHEAAVQSVAFSPDGRFVLTGLADNTAVIWDAHRSRPLFTLTHGAPVQSVAFSPDGRFVITGSADHTAVIWDLGTGKTLSSLKDTLLLAMRRGYSRADLPPTLQREKDRVEKLRHALGPNRPERSKYESSAAFQARLDEYTSGVADYNRSVSELQRNIKEFYATAPQSLVTSQRNQVIADAFLDIAGKPYLGNSRYDPDTATFFIEVTSDRLKPDDFQRTLAVSVPNAEAQEFDTALSEAQPEITFRIDRSGSIHWEGAAIRHLGKVFLAHVIDEAAFKPVVTSLRIDTPELRALQPVIPELIQVSEMAIQVEGDLEIISMQERLSELRIQNTSEEAKARRKVQMAKEILLLEQEILQRRSELARTDFEDDLPGRLMNATGVRPDHHRYLFAVGIHDYEEVPDVPFADRSAHLFHQTAQHLFGVPEENAQVLSEREATGTRISSRLNRLLNRVGPDDTLYFYYAGHGVPSRDGKSSYLLPVDGDAGSYQDDSRMALSAIYQRLAQSGAGRIVSFIDACFSGQTGPDKLVFSGVAPLMVISDSPVPDPDRMTVFAAGKSDQFSNQYAKKGHRLFTYFLIDGLLAGHTEVADLAQYVSEKVDRESRRLGASYTQEPQLYGNTGIDLAR